MSILAVLIYDEDVQDKLAIVQLYTDSIPGMALAQAKKAENEDHLLVRLTGIEVVG